MKDEDLRDHIIGAGGGGISSAFLMNAMDGSHLIEKIAISIAFCGFTAAVSDKFRAMSYVAATGLMLGTSLAPVVYPAIHDAVKTYFQDPSEQIKEPKGVMVKNNATVSGSVIRYA